MIKASGILDESEDRDTIDDWYELAKTACTVDDVQYLMNKFMSNYTHDYGTVCHAVAASAVAAATAANRLPGANGGVTGFQAGAVMWEFIQHWMYSGEQKPLRLVDYSEMLYPQYNQKFQKTISPDTWNWLREEAAKLLVDFNGVDRVREHLQSIVDGQMPFGYSVKGN